MGGRSGMEERHHGSVGEGFRQTRTADWVGTTSTFVFVMCGSLTVQRQGAMSASMDVKRQR
ncbi:MAG TPA: hypothetical protein DE147_10205 [Gammaproteobacteria bacterium]|nr:hypothetical protein [Gammaproteobacteria bacterium]